MKLLTLLTAVSLLFTLSCEDEDPLDFRQALQLTPTASSDSLADPGIPNGKGIVLSVALEYMNGEKQHYIDLEIDHNNIPYILYNKPSDLRGGFRPSVSKFSNDTWTDCGEILRGEEGCYYYFDLAIDRGNAPYVVIPDDMGFSGSGALIVRKYEGSAWRDVGTFFMGSLPNLAFDISGRPFVAYMHDQVGVNTFNGTAWETTGNFGEAQFCSGGPDFYPTYALTTSPVGDPFLIIKNSVSGTHSLKVKKYNGSAWVDVGNSWNESNPINFSIEVDQLNTPYVSYENGWGNNAILKVKKFNGNSWEDVGNTRVQDGSANYTALAIDQSGNPYIAYADVGNRNKVRVKKFENGNWEDLVWPELTYKNVTNTNIAIDSNNNLILVYQQLDWIYAKKFDLNTGLPVEDFSGKNF